MIRRETVVQPEVSRRVRWVVLTIGGTTYLIPPDEAVALADQLHDHAEQETPNE